MQDSKNTPDQETVKSAQIIKIDEAQIQSHLDQVVRQSVEETLNGLLEAEADALCGAMRAKIRCRLTICF